MQDRYAGDVGDFGKFVMLRKLSGLLGPEQTLGINWYRVTNPEPNNDGRQKTPSSTAGRVLFTGG